MKFQDNAKHFEYSQFRLQIWGEVETKMISRLSIQIIVFLINKNSPSL